MIDQVKSSLIHIINKYSIHQGPSKVIPSKNYIGNYFAPSFGFLRLTENVIAYDHSIPRKMLIGVEIGSNFAADNKDIRERLKGEIKAALNNLCNDRKGFVLFTYGTAYSQLGWIDN